MYFKLGHSLNALMGKFQHVINKKARRICKAITHTGSNLQSNSKNTIQLVVCFSLFMVCLPRITICTDYITIY